jgi:hypothetical protein
MEAFVQVDVNPEDSEEVECKISLKLLIHLLC